MGDLNATPWSAPYRRFRRETGLEAAYPSALGPASWPSELPVALLPPSTTCSPAGSTLSRAPAAQTSAATTIPSSRGSSRGKASVARGRSRTGEPGVAYVPSGVPRNSEQTFWLPGAPPKGGHMNRIAPLLASFASPQPPSTRSRTRGRPTTSAPRPGASTAPPSAPMRATADWPSHGLDYAETRFSRLTQINAGNVKELGLVWSYNLESTRGVEATPLVVDGDHVRHRVVEHRARDRRAHRQAAVDLRPEGRRARRATRAAATSSTAASRSTRARSSSAPTTAA